MKSFEEQLRKQEARIQAVIDSLVADKQAMEERLEGNQREMRALMETNSTELKSFVSTQISSSLGKAVTITVMLLDKISHRQF